MSSFEELTSEDLAAAAGGRESSFDVRIHKQYRHHRRREVERVTRVVEIEVEVQVKRRNLT